MQNQTSCNFVSKYTPPISCRIWTLDFLDLLHSELETWVSAEHGCSNGVWGMLMKSHHCSSWRSALAACKSMSGLQDNLVGLGVCPWSYSSLPQRPVHTCYSHLISTASAMCNNWNAASSACWTATVQQSFTINGLTSWNSWLTAWRSPDLSQHAFKQVLKTYLVSSRTFTWFST